MHGMDATEWLKLRRTKAGQPFTVRIEYRADNDDCPCEWCVLRREITRRFLKSTDRQNTDASSH